MSSAGAGIPDLQEEDAIAKGLKELEIGKKLEKFEEVKATANVYLIIYREICEEVREYRNKENRLRRAIWLAETVSLDKIEGPNGQLILNIEEARQTIANSMKNIILLFEQAAELEVTVEDDLSPDYEWVRTMAEVNPEELEEQFEKAKM
ncbi:unnamed protein product [Orchesella dallaii]|uniref:Uncharacterized protein n=1 Tax=Orchesella dallaii TaxID=48710 RepID=A0ABP1QLL3_9HEXA